MAFDLKKKLKDSGELLKSGVERTQDSIKKVDLKKTFADAKEKSQEAAHLIKAKADEASQTISEALSKKENFEGLITAKGALQLMYLVMSADGKTADEETQQLCEIGKELDQAFDEYQQNFIAECQGIVSTLDVDDFMAELQDTTRDILDKSLGKKGASIPVKLLLWNLLVMALSDNEFAESESALIRYISKHVGVDKSIIPEMENSIRALMAVEKEITWLKSVNRPYSTVEVQLNELSDRKLAMMQGVHMLINE